MRDDEKQTSFSFDFDNDNDLHSCFPAMCGKTGLSTHNGACCSVCRRRCADARYHIARVMVTAENRKAGE